MTEKESKYDALIVGGGPGGYTAAIRCAQLGMQVALIEKGELGGVCLNWGCIPTKSLLHSADVLREIKRAGDVGIRVGSCDIDLGAMVRRSRDVAAQLSSGVKHLMCKNGVDVVVGTARFLEPGLVEVNGKQVRAASTILATGVRAKDLPHVKTDGKLIWTAREAMTPSFLPEKLLVVGAGAIGVEFASFYSTLGSSVTLVEALDQVLPTEDAEISTLAQAAFEKEGIRVLTGVGIEEVKSSAKKVSASIGGKQEKYDALMLAVGVSGNVHDLNLEAARVSTDKGFVTVDSRQQSSTTGIYAIGDITGAPCLAHKASHEGIIAAESIAGLNPAPLDRKRIPGCTYSYPQIASIGLMEADLAGHEIKVGRFPFVANGKAHAIGEADGLIKTIFDASSGELLGAHMIGPGVTELVQGFAIAMGLETTEAELIGTIFPHPTLSESMHESVLSAYGRELNI